jgi:outer membrane protein assembly factor BamD (BamD/ComL family)
MKINEKEYFDKGMELLRNGNYDDAIRQFKIAKEIFLKRKDV